MTRTVIVLLLLTHCLRTGDVVDSMDAIRFRSPREKGKAELVEGKVGKG